MLLELGLGVAVMTFVVAPLLVFVHEMGHAIEAIRFRRRPVVVVGREPALVHLSFRRFDLRLHPLLSSGDREQADRGAGIGGSCIYDPRGLSVGEYRAIVRAGPVFDAFSGLVLAALAAFVFTDQSAYAFKAAFVAALLQFVVAIYNLLPLDARSDGSKLAALQGHPPDALVAPPPLGDPQVP